ncbi:MAG: nucleotidyltransferase [Thermoplasmatota archaeon]
MTFIGDDDHREAVRIVDRELAQRGFRLMALGSTALLLRTGRLGTTKDVDLHPFPVQDFETYLDATQDLARQLGGNAILEKDGASITLNISVRGKMVSVELIEGADEWISPAILADAVKTAENVGNILVPS